MHYTLLVYEAPEDFAKRKDADPKVREAYMAAWPPYAQAIREAGIFVAGAGLLGPETATTLRLKGGQPQVQDGPYADTKEQLGGFFLLDLPDLDAALAWAARCPCLPGGVVEVRPNIPPMHPPTDN